MTVPAPHAARVMLVDDDPHRARVVEERLWACGYEVVAVIGSAADLWRRSTGTFRT
jgi:CheY-like chemotaxis protein